MYWIWVYVTGIVIGAGMATDGLIRNDGTGWLGLTGAGEIVFGLSPGVKAGTLMVVATSSIQKMASSHAVTKGGPLSHLERTVWQFQRYLARRLTNAAL